MEQTLLPDGVALAGIIREEDLISQPERLTSQVFRVMYLSVSIKEVYNANRKQEPETWDQAHRSVPQATVCLRSIGGRWWKAPLPTGGRSRVQESLGSRDGCHRTCLRWVGLLERGDGHCCHCAPAYREFPGGNSADHRDCRGHTWRRQAAGQGADPCDGTCPGSGAVGHGGEKLLPHTQPEGRTGRSGSLVLPRLWQELLGCHRPDAQGLPGRASGQLDQPDNRREISRQASFNGSLPCSRALETTRASTSRGGKR